MSTPVLSSSSSSASSTLSYLIARPPPSALMACHLRDNIGMFSGNTCSSGAMDSMLIGPVKNPQMQQPPRPAPRQCRRCGSMNTKFCYYNNYNRSQPRYLCKACRRHWTEGGTLRDVPVGGGRKNKRSSRSSKSSATTIAAEVANNASGSSTSSATNSTSMLSIAPGLLSETSGGVFPEYLQQILFQSPLSSPMQTQLASSGCGVLSSDASNGGMKNDFSAWQAAATIPTVMYQGLEAENVQANIGAGFWGGWEDEISGLDGV